MPSWPHWTKKVISTKRVSISAPWLNGADRGMA
jgi:hypothetical protein